MKVSLMTSDAPQDDLMKQDFDIWASTSDTNYAQRFSAVCLLTASYMAEVLGKNKVDSIFDLNVKFFALDNFCLDFWTDPYCLGWNQNRAMVL